jgi:hypothetical protein
MQAISVRDIKPRGSPRRAVVRITRMWDSMNKQHERYEIGFMFVDHMVLSSHQHALPIPLPFPAHETYAISLPLRSNYLSIFTYSE